MATPAENLATSLEILKTLQDRGITAIRASHLTRIHRERLLKNGFLREVMKGWYIPARPDEEAGESTAWYASFWSFMADYLNERFGDAWCLSPEQSIALHTGEWTVPRQVLVRTPAGGNKPVTLPFGTSILDARLALPHARDMEVKDGIRIYQLPAALIACSPTNMAIQPVTMRASPPRLQRCLRNSCAACWTADTAALRAGWPGLCAISERSLRLTTFSKPCALPATRSAKLIPLAILRR